MSDEQITPVEPDATDDSPAKARKRSRRVLLIAVLVLLVGALAVGGWFAWQQIDTRNRALSEVDKATTLIENADVVVLEVDEIVRAEITSEVGAQASEIQTRVPDAVADLDAAAALLNGAMGDLREEDTPRAEALRDAALARSEMLASADPILEANAYAAAALTPALAGWDAVLEGEKLLDDAVVEYNKLTDAAVKKSRDITVQAEQKLQSAEDLFSEAATAFPEADFAPYQKYIDGKQQLVTLSKQADNAFLKGDKAKANDLSDTYNAQDKKMVEQGKALPGTPAEVIADAYERVAGEATAAYFEARDRATVADKALQDLES